MQAEVDEQRRTIQALRAELAGGNEKLARQAQHFRDELRRLGSGAIDGGGRGASEAPRLTLAERIVAPKIPRPATEDADKASGGDRHRDTRPGGFLKALTEEPKARATKNDRVLRPRCRLLYRKLKAAHR